MVLGALPVLLILGCLAFASRAQAGEVHFDPESPAGKEYALPLQQARHEALGPGGGEGDGGSAAAAAPLFGVGVGDGPSGGESRRPHRDSTAPRSGGAPPSSSHSSPPASDGSPSLAAKALSATDSSFPVGQAVLLLAGLLLLGVAFGLGLRARGLSH